MTHVQNSLSGPSAATLTKDLPDAGDALASQLATLHADPSPERCERVAQQLEGVRQHVYRLRAVLIAERDEG